MPRPIRVYVNRSSFMDGLRAIPTTRAASTCPIPPAQPPTPTRAIAQPRTDVPAKRCWFKTVLIGDALASSDLPKNDSELHVTLTCQC